MNHQSPGFVSSLFTHHIHTLLLRLSWLHIPEQQSFLFLHVSPTRAFFVQEVGVGAALGAALGAGVLGAALGAGVLGAALGAGMLGTALGAALGAAGMLGAALGAGVLGAALGAGMLGAALGAALGG